MATTNSIRCCIEQTHWQRRTRFVRYISRRAFCGYPEPSSSCTSSGGGLAGDVARHLLVLRLVPLQLVKMAASSSKYPDKKRKLNQKELEEMAENIDLIPDYSDEESEPFSESDSEVDIQDIIENASSSSDSMSDNDVVVATLENSWNPGPPKDNNRLVFEGDPGIKINIGDKSDPLEYFRQLFTENLLDLIVRETNKYATEYLEENASSNKSRNKDWKECDKNEMMCFIALIILQGLLKKPRESMYFSKRPCIETPFYRQIMKERRFFLLKKFLHFTDNNEEQEIPNAKLNKLWPIIEMVNKIFSTVYIPEENISIDESLMLYKGRLSWKQYIPSKRARFGIKLYKLCESSSSYIWSFIIYTGKGTTYEAGLDNQSAGSKIVLTLANPLLDKGYCLIMDNFYMSPELCEILLERKTDSYGTLKKNRKGLPTDFATKKLKLGETVVFHKNKLMVVRWKDKKDIHMISTIHKGAIVEKTIRNKTVKKPDCIFDYNIMMGGVDRSDQCMDPYAVARKRLKKYYKKLFFHLVDMILHNAYVLYKKDGGKLCHEDFQTKLVERIIEEHFEGSSYSKKGRPSRSEDPLRLTGRHFPEHIPQSGSKSTPTRRCRVCCSKTDADGKKIRKETRVYCPDCNVALCAVPCFRIYHTTKQL